MKVETQDFRVVNYVSMKIELTKADIGVLLTLGSIEYPHYNSSSRLKEDVPMITIKLK